MEWDSLVIIPESKIIINIEVKSGNGWNPLKKAARQTSKHLSIFKTIFKALLSTEWSFVKAVCTPILETAENKKPCDDCKQFILQQVGFLDMKPWIQSLMEPTRKYTEDNYKTEYDNLLIEIIGFSSIRQSDNLNKLILDPKELSKETEIKLTVQGSAIQGENEIDRDKLLEAYDKENNKSEYLCYMLTPDQLMAVKDTSPHIIIEGDYGCGKTYVLKERTKQCAEKYPDDKITYINLTNDDQGTMVDIIDLNMMDMIAKNNFKDYNNVDVVTSKDLYDHWDKHKNELIDIDDSLFMIYGEDCSLVINHFLEQSTYHHSFIDEIPPFQGAISKYDFFSLEKMCCVTMKCVNNYDNKNEEWIIQMEKRYNAKKITLKHNLRNLETIVNLAYLFSDYDKVSAIPSNNIPGPECYHYHNIHQLNKDMLARAVILKYFKHKPHESSLVLTELISSSSENIYNNLKKNFSTNRNVVYLPSEKLPGADYEKHIREVKEYIKKPDGILVTDIESFHGAQARNIIIISDYNSRPTMRNMIMRTLSFAIIIHNKDIFKESVPGLVRDDNLHEYIHPGNTEQLFCKNRDDDEHRSICDWPLNSSP